MEVHRGGCVNVGQEWVGVEEQHQPGALLQLLRDGPLPNDPPGLLYKVRRKVGAIEWRRTWHVTHPLLFKRLLPLRSPRSLPSILA